MIYHYECRWECVRQMGGKEKKKSEESGNCNVKISTRVKGSVVHTLHTKGSALRYSERLCWKINF